MEMFEQETNPLVARRRGPDRAASNQDFGRL
jgi:hypothetical protein